MTAGMLAFLLVVTFALSWYAAWGVGRYWTEAKIIGGWMRLLVGVSALVAASGFTWVYLTLLAVFATGLGYITVEQAGILFNLGSRAFGGPLLGSASAIWLHSRVLAFRRQELGDEELAAYGKLEQARLIWWGARNANDSLGNILEGLGFGRLSRSAMTGPRSAGTGESSLLGISLGGSSSGGGSSKGWSGGGSGGRGGKDSLEAGVFLLFVLLAILAICGGVITTILIVGHADRVHAVDVTQYFDV